MVVPWRSCGDGTVAVGLWLLARSVRDTRARADRFHVGEALAVGYGLNFLQPTGYRLEPGRPARQLLVLADAAGGPEPPEPSQVRTLLVALPRVVDDLDNASIVGLRRALQQGLGDGWWIGSARLNQADAAPVPPGPDTLAGKPAGLANGSGGAGTAPPWVCGAFTASWPRAWAPRRSGRRPAAWSARPPAARSPPWR